MSTPLYNKMKRGNSFYAFPNAIHDWNESKMGENFTFSFTKYALLNIPQQETTMTGIQRDQEHGVMNFDKDDSGPRFYNFQPGKNSDLPTNFSDQLIESLRNYVSNYDTVLRESRVNTTTDFYNVNETVTPTEMIFWKWARKLNLIDFEPAEHKIDWDKNLTDFKNTNGSNHSHFQKYLWKERDVNNYACTIIDVGGSPTITVDGVAKFKVGDVINFSGETTDIINGDIIGNTNYIIDTVIFGTSNTILTLSTGNATGTVESATIRLSYNRLIEAVGDIQSVSQIKTSKNNMTDVSFQIPNHAGATPTILFELEDNTNYYPGLEMPILPQEQQSEIFGSEKSNSPIRMNPEDYPGTHFGYFDTEDKSYECSNGDRSRYTGDYYGINLTSNIGLDAEDYIENLRDFNSNNIDGVKIDFNQDHYMKMNLPEYLIRNFEEFNSTYFDSVPKDYYFNTILWYYEIDDGSGTIKTNLFGIEFLNDPNDDDDDCDINNKLITPYRKLVSNGEQDGYSYIFNLNLEVSIDNTNTPRSYDPTTLNNQFGFDLYQNILRNNALLQDSFLNVISGQTSIQSELFDLRSLVMNDTDISKIKSQITNLNDLLTLYSTMQFVDSDTITTEVVYDGAYPTIKMNMVNTNYETILDVNTTDVFEYNVTNSGSTYSIPITNQNRTLLNLWNDNNDFNGDTKILINKDLSYKQSMEIFIQPNISETVTSMNLNINFSNSGVETEQTLISDIVMPIDLVNYDSTDPMNSVYTNSYYNNTNIFTYSSGITTGTTDTIIHINDPMFEEDDYIYIDNFYVNSGSNVIDLSGVYQVSGRTNNDLIIKLDSSLIIYKSTIKISYYKGLKINILRVGQSDSTSLTNRYKITKELI